MPVTRVFDFAQKVKEYVHDILVEYANQIDENGIAIDIREYVNNDTIKQMLPNKILIG